MENTDEKTGEFSGYASVFGNVDDGGGYPVPEVYANEIIEFWNFDKSTNPEWIRTVNLYRRY